MAFFQTAANVGYFLITVYALSYITQTLGPLRSVASNALMVGAAVDLFMQPVFGWLSDKYGRKKVLWFWCNLLCSLRLPVLRPAEYC